MIKQLLYNLFGLEINYVSVSERNKIREKQEFEEAGRVFKESYDTINIPRQRNEDARIDSNIEMRANKILRRHIDFLGYKTYAEFMLRVRIDIITPMSQCYMIYHRETARYKDTIGDLFELINKRAKELIDEYDKKHNTSTEKHMEMLKGTVGYVDLSRFRDNGQGQNVLIT